MGQRKGPLRQAGAGLLKEAPIGIEPMHEGFADLSLTAWVRRHRGATIPQRPRACKGKNKIPGTGDPYQASTSTFAGLGDLFVLTDFPIPIFESHQVTNALAI